MESKKELRNALGQFPTGVAIVTTCDSTGSKVGLTINSFSSVSLDPPIVSWCLCKSANSLDIFKSTDSFAIHVLCAHQESISQRFATKTQDKFIGLSTEASRLGPPLLTDYISRFICSKYCSISLGDHVLFAGRVEHFDTKPGEPLAYLRGRYAAVDEVRVAS